MMDGCSHVPLFAVLHVLTVGAKTPDRVHEPVLKGDGLFPSQ